MKKFIRVYSKILLFSGVIFIISYFSQSLIQLHFYRTSILSITEKFVLFIVVIGLYHFLDKQHWDMKWGSKFFYWDFLKGGIIGSVLILISITTISFLTKSNFIPTHSSMLIVSLSFTLLASFFASLYEEVFFRGYIQGLATHYYNEKVGIVFSTLFFAFFHMANNSFNILAFIQLLFVGLFLGIIRTSSQGLWLSIGIHFSWNFIEGGIFGYPVSGQVVSSAYRVVLNSPNQFISGGNFGPEASIITNVVMLLACFLALAHLLQSEKKRRPLL